MILAVPLMVVTAAVVYIRRRRKKITLSPERQKVYNAVINGSVKDPNKLRALSDVFAGEGYMQQAKLLRQRAALRELPDHVQRQRRIIFKRALKSTNKAGLIRMADAYDKQGCTGAAARLREVASGLPDKGPVKS